MAQAAVECAEVLLQLCQTPLSHEDDLSVCDTSSDSFGAASCDESPRRLQGARSCSTWRRSVPLCVGRCAARIDVHLKLNFQTPLHQEFILLLLEVLLNVGKQEVKMTKTCKFQDVVNLPVSLHSGLAFVWVKSVTGK
jgi:hypothetical protein